MANFRTRKLVSAFRRRWPIFPALALIFALATIVVARTMPPTYEAEAVLRIDLTAGAGNGQAADGLLGEYLAEMLTSSRTLTIAATADGLRGLGYTPAQLSRVVSAAPIRGTDAVGLKAHNSNPAVAARIANSVAQAAIDQNRREAEVGFASSKQQIGDLLTRVNQQLIQLSTASGPDPGGGQSASLQIQYVVTLARQQALAQEIANRTDALSLLQAAVPPQRPISPDQTAYFFAATILAISVATMGTLILELLSDPVLSAEDFGRAIGAELVIRCDGGLDSPLTLALASEALARRFPAAHRILLSCPSMATEQQIAGPLSRAHEVVPAILDSLSFPARSRCWSASDVLLIVSTATRRNVENAAQAVTFVGGVGVHNVAALLLEG